MSIKNFFTILLTLVALGGSAQTNIKPAPLAEDAQITFANTILTTDLRKHLTTLASPEYEGRETGEQGQKKAAEYIANYFTTLGLPKVGDEGSHSQNIGFHHDSWNEISLKVNNEKYKYLWDFYAFPNSNAHQPSIVADEVLFLGYGIDDEKYSDYANVNVKDKVILIYQGEPLNADSVSHITGSYELSDWSTDWEKKLRTAKKHGVKAVLFIENDIKFYVDKYRRFLLGGRMSLGKGKEPAKNFANSCYISTSVAKKIIGKKFKKVIKARQKAQKSAKPVNVLLPAKIEIIQNKLESSIIGENVLGFVEGSDPQLKDELLIITAHYDHLGRKGDDIFHGADDNASGTSAVMEVIEAFALAKRAGKGPRRSVLAMLVSGEEKGLLGSEYYVNNPIFPLEKTIANLNVDMVGRVDEKHKNNPNYIYVIGANRISTDLHNINEAMNRKYANLELDYTYNDPNDVNRYYYRSDHYNFAAKGIPAAFYFNGTHEDYHRPSDTVDKINFDKMEKIARLVFHTAWELVNRDKRIVSDIPQNK